MKNPLRAFLSLCLECCYLLLIFFWRNQELQWVTDDLRIHACIYVCNFIHVCDCCVVSVCSEHAYIWIFLSESSTNKWAIFFLMPIFLEDAEWPYSLLSTASFSWSKASFCMYYVGKFAHKNEWDLLYEKD